MKNPKKFVKKQKDKLKGGLADKAKDSEFDKKQLAMGIKIEMEHTTDSSLAREIAKDHLKEIPDYYTRLRKLEAKAEKEGVKKAESISTEDPKTKKIAKLIERHNRKKLNKAIDFKDTFSSIDSKDQELAEKTACPSLVSFIKNSINTLMVNENKIISIPIAKGTLSLSQKDKGLYQGFFKDEEGQVVEKFDNFTPELIAKNLELKELYMRPESAPKMTPSDNEDIENVAKEEAQELIEEHNRKYHSNPSYVRVRCGDVEFEIRKSINNFVKLYREYQTVSKEEVRKSINIWARNYMPKRFKDEFEAARELSRNWDEYREGFLQTLFAEEELKKSK